MVAVGNVVQRRPLLGIVAGADRFRSALLERSSSIISMAEEGDRILEFARAVTAGISATPPAIDCRYLYDTEGSRLYEKICCQPEYYLTGCEDNLLRRHAGEIRAAVGAATLLELGSGNSTKTAHLLNAWTSAAGKTSYIPIDISRSALESSMQLLAKRYPTARFIGLHSSYGEAVRLFGLASPSLVLFLGSSIGNMDEREMIHFLMHVAMNLRPGDHMLLGVDLVKGREVLEAAYNDKNGVSAAFTRNLFARMNRELEADIAVEEIRHEATFNAAMDRIEISAYFTTDQTVYVAPLQHSQSIKKGERIRTEISRKFHLSELQVLLPLTGFEVRKVFLEERQWYALLLLRRSSQFMKGRA